MNFDWDSLPPEARERIQKAAEAMETPVTPNAIPEPAREETQTLQAEQKTFEELTQTNELKTGFDFPVRDVTPPEMYQEIDNRQHEHHAPRILDEAIQQYNEAQTREAPQSADSYPSMADAPAEIQAEYNAYQEQIEAEKSPEQKAQDEANREAYDNQRAQEAERELKEREMGDDD